MSGKYFNSKELNKKNSNSKKVKVKESQPFISSLLHFTKAVIKRSILRSRKWFHNKEEHPIHDHSNAEDLPKLPKRNSGGGFLLKPRTETD